MKIIKLCATMLALATLAACAQAQTQAPTSQQPTATTIAVLDSLPRQYGSPFRVAEDTAMVPIEMIPQGSQPVLEMYNAYRLYHYVEFCHHIREGYVVVNINDVEMQRAKQATKLIEHQLSLSDADLEVIWQRAVKANSGMWSHPDQCQEFYRALVKNSGMANYNTRRP
jgi:hypothetical protein